MDKVDKFIAKLDTREALCIVTILDKIFRNDLEHLDVKKLKGRTEEYRVRVGRIRIQFVRLESRNIITYLGNRDENTYS